MITRGHFIGQIVDELSSVAEKMKSRAKLGLFDIHRYLEDFYGEILNITLDLKLENLNQERKNSPGLDLGDKEKGIAFQITGEKTSEKVNKTLEKASSQKNSYPEIKILILQNKQGSYTLNENFAKVFSFTDKDIWDVNDVLNRVMYLEIDKLQELSKYISKELARVTIELEIPDTGGKYQTNIDKYVEKIPKERFCGVKSYLNFHSSKEKFDMTEEGVVENLNLLIIVLKKLPRITRQFYAFLYSRSDWDFTEKYINADYLERICTFPDMEGELRLLGEAGLCSFNEPNYDGESAKYQITFPMAEDANGFSFGNVGFSYEFNEYIEYNNINLENVLVSLDFSSFEKLPS